MNRLDPKLLILVGATVVAGLLGARSIMTAGPSGDSGFGGVQPMQLGIETDSSPPLEFDWPADPRNPFADARDGSLPDTVETTAADDDGQDQDAESVEP